MNTPLSYRKPVKFALRFADEHDREIIYRMRHEVYARELGQHNVRAPSQES